MHDVLWALSALAALAYGLILVGREPSSVRTIVKVVAVALLAVLALLQGAPGLLIGGLAFCALGDAFLAGNPKRWLTFGMLAFLIGHLLYIFLFAHMRDPLMEPGPIRLAGLGAVALASVLMLAHLWKSLGVMRPAVILYVIAIGVMTGSSFLLSSEYWPIMVGSVAFMASDAVLAMSLFREEKLFGSARASDWAVWFLYYGAQVLIAWPFISPLI